MKVNPTTDAGKKVLAYLQDNPMPIKHFAEKIGLSRQCIQNLLEGEKPLGFFIELKINKFFNDQQIGI